MARRGQRDLGKERFWRRRLRQWQRSGLTIRDYCAAQGLSEASFYAWRRAIQERMRPVARASRDGARPIGRGNAAGVRPGPSNGLPTFVPVRIVASAPALEVVGRAGCVIRVPVGFDAATLRQLLAVLAEVPPC
jgi:hypothetical protein